MEDVGSGGSVAVVGSDVGISGWLVRLCMRVYICPVSSVRWWVDGSESSVENVFRVYALVGEM